MPRRLALPLTLTPGGRCATVEQGSDEDLLQSVALALDTVRGERTWAPQVGLEPQQGLPDVDPSAVRRAVASADLDLPDSAVDVQVLSGPPDAQVRVTVLGRAVDVAL